MGLGGTLTAFPGHRSRLMDLCANSVRRPETPPSVKEPALLGFGAPRFPRFLFLEPFTQGAVDTGLPAAAFCLERFRDVLIEPNVHMGFGLSGFRSPAGFEHLAGRVRADEFGAAVKGPDITTISPWEAGARSTSLPA